LPLEERKRWFEEDKKLLSDKQFQELVRRSPESALAWNLYQKLLRGAASKLHKHHLTNILEPARVAHFLAWLAYSKKSRLTWTVERGLDWLGISRPRRPRGRARGITKQEHYNLYVEEVLKLLEESGLWGMKKQMRNRYRKDWQKRLRRTLAKDYRWPVERIDLFITAKTLRSFCIWLATIKYGVSYDAVARALQQGSTRSGKK
jgi:hypothetical protein